MLLPVAAPVDVIPVASARSHWRFRHDTANVRYPYVVFYTIDDAAQEVIILVFATSQDTEHI